MPNYQIVYRPCDTDADFQPYIHPDQGELIYVGSRDALARIDMLQLETSGYEFRAEAVDKEPTIIGSSHKRIQVMHPETRGELMYFLMNWLGKHMLVSESGLFQWDGWAKYGQRAYGQISTDAERIIDHELTLSALEPGVAEATTWSAVLTLLKESLLRCFVYLNEEGHSLEDYEGMNLEAARISLLMGALLMHQTHPVPDVGMFPGRKAEPEKVSCPRCGEKYDKHSDPADNKYICWHNSDCQCGWTTPEPIELYDLLRRPIGSVIWERFEDGLSERRAMQLLNQNNGSDNKHIYAFFTQERAAELVGES